MTDTNGSTTDSKIKVHFPLFAIMPIIRRYENAKKELESNPNLSPQRKEDLQAKMDSAKPFIARLERYGYFEDGPRSLLLHATGDAVETDEDALVILKNHHPDLYFQNYGDGRQHCSTRLQTG